MSSQSEVFSIINQLREGLHRLFPQEQFDVILFGSYACNDTDDGSDIDVLFLPPQGIIACTYWVRNISFCQASIQ